MYHWLPRRIEAHIKLCVFALLIERVAELKCKEPWPQIKRSLDTLQASEFHTPKYRFFQRNEASAQLSRKLKSLEIPMPKAVLELQSATSNA
jgi:transposase